MSTVEFSQLLTDDLLERVVRPGQYLGNEWGARRKDFQAAQVRLALTFPDLYELGMSNFGLKILYQLVNEHPQFLADRCYAPATDMEELLRQHNLPLWGWESREALKRFELIGFSLQYELTYTNVLNMLELAHIPVFCKDRTDLFPLIFGGGPSAVNPEPMADFLDFFIIGDGENALPAVMSKIQQFKLDACNLEQTDEPALRQKLLAELAVSVPGVYVPSLYQVSADSPVPKPVDITTLMGDKEARLPERVLRQTVGLSDSNQPTESLVPYINLVHDREVLEVRRGCDRGCRFCQPGYTFLPVRERSADDILRLSKVALDNSGHQEYSMLSLCVSDYTSLHDSIRSLNEEHSARRASLSIPSQRADRMNLDLAEELKAVRKSGITLAPEAGTERLRMVINKGLSHQQIINAIEAAYQSGWGSVKLYFMCCLPTERDEDLVGIVEILKEASLHCRAIRKKDPLKHRKDIEFTCTISNFVPKPFTPFQWFGQISPKETARKHQVLRQALREARLKNVQLNVTEPQISLLEAALSRGDRKIGRLIYDAWRSGCTFDAWDDRYQPEKWHKVAAEHGITLEELSCTERIVGSEQPWDVIHIGLNTWWMVKEWEKAMTELETAPCTENLCHACGVCTELETTHRLAAPKTEVIKRNPFVKELSVNTDPDHHPSLFVGKKADPPTNEVIAMARFTLTKKGDLRFISHLDLQHLIARAARRANINVAYSRGFNPQPKVNLAAALPLFQEADAEVGEIELAHDLPAEEFKERINRQLPPEIQFTQVKMLPPGSKVSLSALLAAARYSAQLITQETGESDESFNRKIEAAVQQTLDAKEVVVQPISPPNSPKISPPHDIRPGILALEIVSTSPLTLQIELAHGSQLHVKPTELLSALSNHVSPTHPVNWRITRQELKGATGSPLFHS